MKAKFEAVTVFIVNTKSFNRGAAVTIPGVGIFVGMKCSQDTDLLRHEFGHVLQFRQKGFFFFLVQNSSSKSAKCFSKFEKGKSYPHAHLD